MKFRTFRKRVLRTLNGLLAGVLLCGSFTACGKENTPAGTDATSENATSPATDSGNTPSGYPSFADLSYAETIGKPKIRAAFAGSGKAEGIPFLLASPSGDVSASVSARWNSDGVTFSFIGGKAETVAITMGNYKNTLTLAQGSGSVTVSIAEAKLSLVDVGQELPLKMELRNGSASLLFDGCVVLNDYDVYFSSDSSRFTEQFGKAKLSVMGKTEAVSNADSGVKASGGAITLFDRYTSVGKNYGHLRNTVTSKPISGLGYAQKNLLLEFDLNLKNMPVQSWSYLEADYAYGFSVALCGKGRGTIIFGFVNTADGIYAYVNGKTSDATIFLPTGKQVGETFHAGLVWIGDKIEIFIDNVSIGYVTDAANSDSGIYAENTLTLVWQRSADAPAGSDDNFVAEINRMTLANLTPYTLLGTVSADSLLGTEARVVDGDGIFLADRDLTLPTVLENRKYGLHANVAWYSDNPTVIGVDGKLTKPESTGEIVTLKAVLIFGRTIITEAQFSFFVKAKNPVSNVLRLKYDKDPVKGSGTTADTTYIADGVYNSIIYDMKQSESINRAVLYSLNAGTRVTKNFVALYTSDDNKTYTAVPDFAVLYQGGTLYFYNFSVKARYLKIHFTFDKNPVSSLSVFQSLQKQMRAWYEDTALLANGEFAHRTTVPVSNPLSSAVYNKIVAYSLSDLGIPESELQSDRRDLRFRLGETDLPHAFNGGRIFVRIPEIGAGKRADITVLWGNAKAESIENPQETFEAEYGTKVVTSRLGVTDWRNSVALMPDGSLLTVGGIGKHTDGKTYLGMERSTDGGRTWTATQRISCTAGISDGGGFIVDYETKTVYYFGFETHGPLKWGTSVENTSQYLRIFVSKDSGKSWTKGPEIQGLKEHTIMASYSNGIRLSCYDGDGPQVDYVFTTGIKREDAGGVFALAATAVYSADGGKTWKISNSRINYAGGSLAFEGGVGEETVYEQKNGNLILYARCQVNGVTHFAVAHSYDHGVTWEEDAKLSNVYTSNTQPILVDNNGTPVLLWGGNNSMGGKSYCRFPLNVAYSTDGGETFGGILDISFQTFTATRIAIRANNELYHITNPDMVLFNRGGVDCAYILTTNYRFLVENFSNYLYKTKGAFDSFENGSAEAEGWIPVVDSNEELAAAQPTIVRVGATHGNYAMHIGLYSKLSRSIPSVTNGIVSMDLFVEKMGGMTFELQTAYNSAVGVSAPITLTVDANGAISYSSERGNPKTTGLFLSEGANHISITFNGKQGTATLSVNGKNATILFRRDIGDCICFAYLYTQKNTSVAMDCFTVIDMD